MRTSIQVFGDTQFSREVKNVGRRGTRAKPMYDALGFRLQKIQAEQFASQGARGSGGWRPLADSTVRGKGHAIIFLDTSELMESFKYGDPLNLFEATDDFLLWGSLSTHGQWHQPDPQDRKVFELTGQDRRDIVRAMHRWVIFGDVVNVFGDVRV